MPSKREADQSDSDGATAHRNKRIASGTRAFSRPVSTTASPHSSPARKKTADRPAQTLSLPSATDDTTMIPSPTTTATTKTPTDGTFSSQPEPSPTSTGHTTTTTTTAAGSAAPPGSAAKPSTTSNQFQARMARFKSLQIRQQQSSQQNLVDSAEERRRLATDPAALAALTRKHAVAMQELLRLEAADDGADFERKRAWDWTAEESAKWDRRMEKKERHRREAGFQDFAAEARKTYRRQVRDMGAVDLSAYQRSKLAAIESAVAEGTLEIVETDDGEMIAIDRDGTFYSTADAAGSAARPDKAAVDRLVSDMRKADEERLKKRRRDRAKLEDDDGTEDVTYINLKNKQFNEKLSRFYDKYTVGIRESFERGTAV